MFKVQGITVRAALMKEACERVPEKLEDALNAGAKKGWRLHSWQQCNETEAKEVHLTIVWEVPSP